MTLVASDAWEDLGSREKLGPDLKTLLFASPSEKRTPEALHLKRLQNLRGLETLRELVDSIEETDNLIRIRTPTDSFDYWPASGCWISYGKNKYGMGLEEIRDLCKAM